MRPWLITDTHFGHDGPNSSMILHCGRPQDFSERIVRNILRLVNPETDFLIHLGDVGMCRKATLVGYLERLKSLRMILIRGNHDHESDSWYMTHGFQMVCESMVFRRVLLSHAPAPKLPTDASLNVFGHLHNNQHHAEYALKWYHKLLAIEDTGLAPVLWEKWVGGFPVPPVEPPQNFSL